jgi:putative Holliday junction resolvase
MKRIAALDIGTVRVGIAMTNDDGTLAMPHSTVHIKQCSNPFAEIARILAEHQVSKVVIGWPLELDGSEGPAIRRTKQFLVQLKPHCAEMKWVKQDERLSSIAAEDALQAMETTGSQRKNHVDAMAACLILQRYLEKN